MPCNCEVEVLDGRSQHLIGCEFWLVNGSVVQNNSKNWHQIEKGTKNGGHNVERDPQKGHSAHHPHRKVYDEEEIEIEEVEHLSIEPNSVRLDIF